METTQEQALETKRFRHNQVLFQRCTAIDVAIKTKHFTAVQPALLSPLMYQLTGFGAVTALQMLQHMLIYYGDIDKIDL